MRVKPYIPSRASIGDLQGDDYEVPEEIQTKSQWEEFKQQTINDFISKYEEKFKEKYGRTPSEFGVGIYKDNKKNRSLNRVGMTYDRGHGIRNYYEEQIRNRNIIIPMPVREWGPSPIPIPEQRPWTQQDILYLDQMQERGVPVPTIAEHLLRTSGAVYSKSSRIRYGQPI